MVEQTLGHYRVLRKLGAGGMGEVYLADDTKLQRQVALKILAADLAGDRSARERLEREARAVAALNHPNIVTLYSIEEAERVAFLTLEYVEGQTLASLIPPGGLPLDRLLALAIPIADAVGTAHLRGITHRDLKPSNVMVTPDGRVKVLDFGLARVTRREWSDEQTAVSTIADSTDGRLVGTVSYMSPEQAEGKPADSRSDVFALGVMLYEMATRQRPFRGESTMAMLSAILKDTPAALAALRPDVPPEFARVVSRCLEKDPDNRYQTATDLRNDLRPLAGTAPAAINRFAVRRQTRAAMAMALIPTLLLIGGALVWRFGMPGPGEATPPVAPASQRASTGVELSADSVSRLSQFLPRVNALFDTPDVSMTPTDATHVGVSAPADRLASAVSALRLADALARVRFFEEPAVRDSSGSRFLPAPARSDVRVSLAVRDVRVDGLLRLIAASAGWPLVIDHSVRGAVTLAMDEVPWDLLVRSCLETRGLDLATFREGDVWVVSTRQRIAEIAGGGQLRLWLARSRRLPLTDAVHVLEPARSPRGLVLPNPRLGAVVVIDEMEAFARYAQIVGAIDGVAIADIDHPRPESFLRDQYAGTRLALEIGPVEAEHVMRVIASQTRLNLVVEPRITGAAPSTPPRTFTVVAANARWDNLFQLLMRAAGLRHIRENEVIHVVPAGAASTEVVVETVTLRREAPAFFKPLQQYLTTHGAMSVEENRRVVVIRDVAPVASALAAWMRTVDAAGR